MGMAGRLCSYSLSQTTKAFQSTNSFYKAGCALTPVISRPQRGGERKEMALVSENDAHVFMCPR